MENRFGSSHIFIVARVTQPTYRMFAASVIGTPSVSVTHRLARKVTGCRRERKSGLLACLTSVSTARCGMTGLGAHAVFGIAVVSLSRFLPRVNAGGCGSEMGITNRKKARSRARAKQSTAERTAEKHARRERHAKSCAGKQRHNTETDARSHATALWFTKQERVGPYVCSNCGYWHVGHKSEGMT